MIKLAAYLGLALVVCGCGGASSSLTTSVSHNYLGTQGPGDVWSWNLTDSTFTASNQTKGYTYSGTKSVLSTGFMKLNVQSTTDPGVSVGQSAYALEIPGTALVLKPMGDDTHPPIIAGALGQNPAGPTVSFNFVAVGKQGFDPINDQAYGHVTFTVTGNSYTGTSHRWDIGGTQLADGPSDFTGDNGLMTDQSDGVTGAMSPSGVCVLDYGPGAGGVIGVKQPATNVDLATLGSLSFRGFLINQGKTQCVNVTPNGDGTLHGVGYENPTGVETGTVDPNGSGVTISFLSQPNPGEVVVSIATTGGTDQLVAAINQVGGKYALFCFAVDSQNNPYNVVLVQD